MGTVFGILAGIVALDESMIFATIGCGLDDDDDRFGCCRLFAVNGTMRMPCNASDVCGLEISLLMLALCG